MDGAVARETPPPRPFEPQRLAVVQPFRHMGVHCAEAASLSPSAHTCEVCSATLRTLCVQVLHATHIKPEGVFVTRDASGGWSLLVRPLSDSAADLITQQRLAAAINTRFGSLPAPQQLSPRASQPVDTYPTPQRPSPRVSGKLTHARTTTQLPSLMHHRDSRQIIKLALLQCVSK